MRDQLSSEGNLLASILDRLIDDDPEVTHEPVQYRMLNIRQVKASVIRDLENLLNTRRHIDPPPIEFAELNRSVLTYGIEDFTALNSRSLAVQKFLRQDIERTIARFEPRLRNVKLQLEPDKQGHGIRFKINAMLVIEPEKEPVQFDTFFDPNRGEYVISR
ncbi:MAG TPA: type VI secretion system baseplate subunit TssE [Deltaproteobacteria bacterium]|nr:type VI secretion system baseplate subunit TssE [Deltaproteobacteria bacterium]